MSAYNREQGWLILAHLAELVVRGEASLESLVPFNDALKRGGISGHQIQVEFPHALPVFDRTFFASQGAAYAELVGQRWLERALARGLAGDPVRAAACMDPTTCQRCRAKPGEWCTPTHAGERDPGGWTHPDRGIVGLEFMTECSIWMRPNVEPDRSWINQRVVLVDRETVALDVRNVAANYVGRVIELQRDADDRPLVLIRTYQA